MYHSRKNFHCPTCGTKLNTDSNMDICHICGTDVSDIVNNILIGQEEDGPCGDCGDDINSPYYLGSREDIYEVEDNGGDADDYYEDYGGEDDYDEYEDEEFDSDDYEEIYDYDDDSILDNDYYDDID